MVGEFYQLPAALFPPHQVLQGKICHFNASTDQGKMKKQEKLPSWMCNGSQLYQSCLTIKQPIIVCKRAQFASKLEEIQKDGCQLVV